VSNFFHAAGCCCHNQVDDEEPPGGCDAGCNDPGGALPNYDNDAFVKIVSGGTSRASGGVQVPDCLASPPVQNPDNFFGCLTNCPKHEEHLDREDCSFPEGAGGPCACDEPGNGFGFVDWGQQQLGQVTLPPVPDQDCINVRRWKAIRNFPFLLGQFSYTRRLNGQGQICQTEYGFCSNGEEVQIAYDVELRAVISTNTVKWSLFIETVPGQGNVPNMGNVDITIDKTDGGCFGGTKRYLTWEEYPSMGNQGSSNAMASILSSAGQGWEQAADNGLKIPIPYTCFAAQSGQCGWVYPLREDVTLENPPALVIQQSEGCGFCFQIGSCQKIRDKVGAAISVGVYQ